MSNIYKKIRITWEYPKQPTSLQVGYVRIVRSTEPFVVETALAQTQIDYREYDSSFTSFEDTQDLQENTTYYYMIIVYGDIDNSISAATDLYSVKIEAPEKLYLGGRDTYSYSVRLVIPEWNTVDAWEFKVDGEEYIFDNDESLYDALVSLYSQNIAMPHRLDELPSSDEIARFDIYNNNAHAKTLWFKYVGLQTGTKIEAEVFDGSVISDKVGLDEFEILLAGSCHAQINTIRNFQVSYKKQYLEYGCFYSIELNGKVYAHQLPLSDLYNFNGNGITALFREYPELGDILGGYPQGSGVVLYNRTFQPVTVKIRLDKNLPYLNGNESVWSAEQPTALYLPIVPEEPTPEQVEYYPLGIKQNQAFVPVDITNEGYVFELGPALPEPLKLDLTYRDELDSITRDPVNLSGQVNYSDAHISLTWKDVEYIAQVDSEKSDGKYNWAFEELPYDLFEDVVVESLSGTIDFTITAKTETDEVVRELDVTYHKTTFLKFIGNGLANQPISFIGQTGDVVRYPDGTVLNVINTANTLATLLKNMTGETVIELTGNRSYYSIVTLAGRGLVEVTELPRHARITGIKFHANIIDLNGSSNLTKVPLHLPENIVNLSSTFGKCTKFNQDLSQWDTSNVTNMSSMFSGASAFNQPLNTWDTSNVTNMRSMFYEATAFNSDISTWDTSNVTNMQTMFSYAKAFNSDISGWNTGNVADMIQMFYNANSFNSDISNWDTSSVTNMANMFERAYAFNQPIGNWDVSNVTNMTGMFETNVVFNQDLTNWDTGSVTNMSRMFYQNTAFNGDISGWDTSNVTDMSGMFYKATAFDSDISDWDTSNVINMSSMFYEATAFNQPIGNWLTGKVESTSSMFYGADAFNQPIGNWDVSNVIGMSEMFCYAKVFNQDLSRWNTSNVTTLHRTFTSADAFNSDISTWNTSNVTDMSGMFLGAEIFNSDISGWNTGKVKDMEEMFAGAWAFNSDISGWDVSNVTDMYYMFDNAKAFNQPIGNWDVSKVTSMYAMFAGAYAFNQDISGWDVSNVVSMPIMFAGARAFNQDLSNWCVSKVTTKPSDFDTNTPSWTLPRPVWGTCPSRIEGPEEPGFGEHLILHSQGDIVLNAPVGSVLYSIDGGETWQENSEDGFTVDLPSGVESAVYLKSNDDVELTDSLNVRSTNTNTSNFKGVHQWWDSSRPIQLGVSKNSFYVPKVAPPNVTDMNRMFFGADAFNQDISQWDVSKVTSMYAMFYSATAFNQPLNNWNVSNVTDMSFMFTGASAFNSDISQWDVSNVTDMNSMFFDAKAFNQDISQWDVSKVTSMYSIFYGATSFNQDISQWDVSKVPNMSSMFYGAGAFNQDLSSWCVSKIKSKPLDFDYNATKWTLPKPVWGTCPRGENMT